MTAGYLLQGRGNFPGSLSLLNVFLSPPLGTVLHLLVSVVFLISFLSWGPFPSDQRCFFLLCTGVLCPWARSAAWQEERLQKWPTCSCGVVLGSGASHGLLPGEAPCALAADGQMSTTEPSHGAVFFCRCV